MVFMMFVTGWAGIVGLKNFIGKQDWLLTGISAAIMLLEVWLIIEAVKVFVNLKKGKA